MRHSYTIILCAFLLLLACGCRGEEEAAPAPPPPPAEEAEEEETAEPRLREVYGLPLPPEYINLRQQERRTAATTRMSMEELKAFFESRHLEDHEVLMVGRRLEIVALRPHLASAQARYFAGPRTSITVTYMLPPDPAEVARTRPPNAEVEESEPTEQIIYAGRQEEQRSARSMDRPEWLDSLRGQPVNLRTETGELLAPDARWGEPYVPPEGSPLHTVRNRHNFGMPFGDWRSH